MARLWVPVIAMVGFILIPVGLVIMAVVLGGVAAGRRRAGRGSVDPGSVRRVFQYAICFALVMVVTDGLAELLGQIPDRDADTLARSLPAVLIGAPLLAVLVWWLHRLDRRDPTEGDSAARRCYLVLTGLVSLIVTAVALQDVLAAVLQPAAPDAVMVGRVLAWGITWGLHWWLARRNTNAHTPHLLLGAAVGLVMGTVGFVASLSLAAELTLRTDLVVRGNGGTAGTIAILVVGAAVWIRYWLLGAARLPRRGPLLAYLLVLGAGGGFVLILVAASRVLWSVLVWFLGDRLGRSAAVFFDTAPVEAAAVLAGLVLWWYHRTMLGATVRRDVQRVYDYVIATIGLVAAAIGVGALVVALIESVTPGTDVGMTTRNTFFAALTVLVVAVPVWWVHWRRIERARLADRVTETHATPRRIHLVVIFGVAGVAAVVALLGAGFALFADVVAGHVGAGTLREMSWWLGTLVASAAVAAHHGAVLRADRRVATPQVSGPRSVVLVGAADDALTAGIRRATGSRVELWTLGEAPAWDESALLAALAEHAGADVLVVNEASGLTVHRVERLESGI